MRYIAIVLACILCFNESSGRMNDPADPEIRMKLRCFSLGLIPEYFVMPSARDSVALDEGAFNEELYGILSRYNPRVIKRSFPGFSPHDFEEYSHIPPLDRFFRIHFDVDTDIPALVDALTALPGVIFAHPRYFVDGVVFDGSVPSETLVAENSAVRKSGYLPDDPVFFGSAGLDQWNLHDDNAGIGCQSAWEYTMGDPEVRIGNIDFGIWWGHDDLDIAGGLFVDYSDSLGHYVTLPQQLDESKCAHATKSAGVLTAQTHNGFAVSGIVGGQDGVGGCSLYDLQLRWEDLSTYELEAWTKLLKSAVSPIEDTKCNVISMSISVPESMYDEEFRGIFRFANEIGVNVVSGAGRSSGPRYPALFDKHWLTVAGVHDSTGALDSNFARGYGLDLVAPGGVWTTTYYGYADPAFPDSLSLGKYVLGSCATPHIAGSIALLRSYLGNGLEPEDYENILKLHADDSGSTGDNNPQTWNEDSGHGKLRIDTAMAAAANHSLLGFHTTQTDTSEGELVTVSIFDGPYAGTHSARRLKVTGGISFGDAFSDSVVAWGSCAMVLTTGYAGVSSASLNYGEPFNEVVDDSVDDTSCEAFTYAYLLMDDNGKYSIWYPAHFNQIWVAVKAMGVPSVNKSLESVDYKTELLCSPNPFNSTVRVTFNIDRRSYYKVDVIDVRGRIVRRLLDETHDAGTVDLVWMGDDEFGRSAGSGMYFSRVVGDGQSHVQKVALVK